MADISTELAAIQNAVYGEEVRGAIVDALEAMNESAESAEMWATGGTGGTASETNNAKYYAAKAGSKVAQTDVAPTFSESKAYSAGDYVYYGGYYVTYGDETFYVGGSLYRFTADHAAGAWIGTDATAATLSDDVVGLVSEMLNANAFDILPLCNPNNVTHRGVTFTWAGGKCNVSGTATDGIAISNIFYDSSGNVFPTGITKGGTYRLKYSGINVKFQVLVIRGGSYSVLVSTNTDMIFTLPSDISGVVIRLAVPDGSTVSETVSPMLFTEVLTNAELMANTQMMRGTIASGTDFDSLTAAGAYLIQSNYTYLHSPFASIYGGTLLVFPQSVSGSVVQVGISYSVHGKSLVRARMGLNGVFPELWSDVSGYTNEYITQHYENTYNITATPTITTDTNNYLASTGDYTDRTADIQTMLDATGVCHLGPGRFVVSGVDVPNYGALIGSGERTVVVLDDSVTTGYAVKLKTQSSVSHMRINGGTTAQNTSPTVGTRHGILFEGTKVSGQSGGVTYKRSAIDHCNISNFSGGGITCTGTGVDIDSNMLISDCFVDHCCAGMYIPYYSEFHRICNCAFTQNWYGVVDNGGNNNFANCDFSGNRIGILIDNSTNQSTNNSHGTFTGCSINHSYSDSGVINNGTAIKLLKSNAGEIFTGNQIFYGEIFIDDCMGIRFSDCNMGRAVPITVSDSVLTTFAGCTFHSTEESPLIASNNVTLKFTECYTRDGSVFDPTV